MTYPIIDGSPQLPTNPGRLEVLKKVAFDLMCFKTRKLSILEVGSLYGDSARALAPFGNVVCVDMWAYGSEDFMDNTKGYYNITAIRGSSIDVLPTLPDKFFDLIYLDGDHRYPTVNRDIIESKRLINDGGIICGDDLELTINADIYEKVSLLKMEDYVNGFHPGVSCAVYDELDNKVNVQEGFWWTQR